MLITKEMGSFWMKNFRECEGEFVHNFKPETNSQYRNRIKDNKLNETQDEGFNNNESHFDTEEKTTDVTLAEEICLLALGDERANISLLNDNIPYVLRACILLELTLARRIKVNIYEGGNIDEPWKLNVIVNDFSPVGDIFMDEAIKIIAKEELSLQKWLYVLTGETWSRRLSPHQMHNLRDRLCKSLIEKGIVTCRKSSLFLFETTEYPLLDTKFKRKICHEIIDSAIESEKLDLRSLCRLLSLNAAKILHKPLKITDAPTSSRIKSFASEVLIKYSKFHNLEAKFGHLLSDGELHLIAGIFSLYEKINKFF